MYLGNQLLIYVTMFKYLGSLIKEDGRSTPMKLNRESDKQIYVLSRKSHITLEENKQSNKNLCVECCFIRLRDMGYLM